MIKLMFSRRHKRKVYRLDATVNGKRFRRFFLKKAEAEAVAYKIKHDTIAKRYGMPVMAERPLLTDLIEKRLAVISPAEHTRATRVLNALADLLPIGYCVDEVTKADIQRYVEKRRADGLKAQSIDRELNIVNAMLNAIDNYYPQLEQWKPPRMPRPKVLDGRRERVWSANEIETVLGELFAPKRDGEQTQAAYARYRAGRKVEFCLMNGVRHTEMNRIRPTDIDWQGRTFQIKQGKTGKVKMIGPVAPRSMAILKEFCDTRSGEYVFSRGGNINRRERSQSSGLLVIAILRSAWRAFRPGVETSRAYLLCVVQHIPSWRMRSVPVDCQRALNLVQPVQHEARGKLSALVRRQGKPRLHLVNLTVKIDMRIGRVGF